MMTAVRPLNNSDALYFNWTTTDYSLQFHVNMHFAELELLGPNMTREFTVCCDNNSFYNSPIRPEYLVTTTIQNPQLLRGQQNYTCSFTKTPNSNFPPILNAIEIFAILQLPTTPTREEDGLKGKITASLANIKYIQSLDLSWNYLTGPVPNFLGDLPFLSSLNLSGNQLSGLIPSNLIEKSEKGSLKLSLDGNPDLCVPGSCSRHSSKRKITVLIAASVACVVILSILLIILRRFKWRKEGFISIDCGIAEYSTYNDKYTTITYQSDAKFIDTGVDKELPEPAFNKLLNNVRSFPNGSRNCYNLSEITKGNKYLVRAYFFYGNYDGENRAPEFDLYFGVNLWTTISFRYPFEAFYEEIITVATMNFISICLLDTGSGTPFISALELRPLKSSMYSPANERQSLQSRTRARLDVGSSTNSLDLRYPEDPFDLIWLSEDGNWSSFNTPQKVINPNEAFQPPSAVMMTAIRPGNDNNELYYSWTARHSFMQFHVYMYFAELERLEPNMKREFTVCCGTDSCFDGHISPEYLVTHTLLTNQPLSGQHTYSCSFKKTPSSTLPPILNAIETLAILQHNSTPTRDQDVDAILDIKAAYQVKRNWMGDPCVPKNYSWQGLTCDYTLSHAPQILSLNLSSAGLNGEIAASLANLNSINSLDLSWNNLTGPVPNFLGDLPFLSSLNLSGNKLSGLVPSNLLEKSKKGSLKLSVDDNPDLCVSDSCSEDSNKQKIIILVVAPLAFVVILLILLIILWRFKWRKQGKHSIA
ncbi:hypothetical protein MRB53_012849 [Persea americana]|uniref:Uncharacterized protein n=1 Tax=Persea americana TaxID=3435 RepID=A0ACC2M054_PERAE|nr:hypothetical protein MRB53_012849 [Persea americana]